MGESDTERHQNRTDCSLGHAPPLQKFHKNPIITFSHILHTDARQTDRQLWKQNPLAKVLSDKWDEIGVSLSQMTIIQCQTHRLWQTLQSSSETDNHTQSNTRHHLWQQLALTQSESETYEMFNLPVKDQHQTATTTQYVPIHPSVTLHK